MQFELSKAMKYFRRTQATPDGSATKPKEQPSVLFSLRLFESLKPGDRNLVISPYGLRVLLSMVWAGASAETRSEIASALLLDENLAPASNHYERAGKPLGFRTEIPGGKLELYAPSSIWCDYGLPVKKKYVKSIRDEYEAQVESIDFEDADSSSRINSWVRERTNDKIQSIVGSVQQLRPMVATNAVYFNAPWFKPFEPANTKEEDFTLPGGEKFLMPLMSQDRKFPYTEIGGVQIVTLHYWGGMGMRIVLPPKDVPFAEFCRTIQDRLGTEWVREMDDRKGHLRLPRFRIEATAPLTATLQSMGIRRAFDPERAQLDGIAGTSGLFLGSVLQKGFLEVNERGTEASVATLMRMLGAAEPKKELPPFTMIVNRPFIFAICDGRSGTILFLGAVIDPRH